jgi:hypothetical protein
MNLGSLSTKRLGVCMSVNSEPTGIEVKKCSRCSQVKPLTEFGAQRGARDGRSSHCLECNRARMQKHYAENAESWRPRHLRRTYGISVDEYEELLEAQGGVCAVCRTQRPFTSNRHRNFSIDHSHADGCDHPANRACKTCIRGLLCNVCNRQVAWLEKYRTTIDAYLAPENRPLSPQS